MPEASKPAATPNPAQGPARRPPVHPTAAYVALGDSLSSGEGVRPFLRGTGVPTNGCHRSSRAYPRLLDRERLRRAVGTATSRSFVACSGAVISDLFGAPQDDERRAGEGNQVSAVTGATRLATISIGSDDAGLRESLLRCVSGPLARAGAARLSRGISLGFGCRSRLDRALQTRLGVLAGTTTSASPRLSTVYVQIAERMARSGRLLVLNYPSVLGAGARRSDLPGRCRPGFGHRIGTRDVRWLHRKVEQLNAVIADEVRIARGLGHDVRVVDVASRLDSHGYCEISPSGRWFNGLIVRDGRAWPGSFHPNALGQRRMAQAVDAALSRR